MVKIGKTVAINGQFFPWKEADTERILNQNRHSNLNLTGKMSKYIDIYILLKLSEDYLKINNSWSADHATSIAPKIRVIQGSHNTVQ